MVAYVAAGLIHLVVIGLVVFNYSFKDEVENVEAFQAEKIDTVKASVIDDRKLEEQMEAIKEKDRKKKEQERLDRERLKKLQDDTKKEQARIEELQRKKKLEETKANQLEQQRKIIALKKKQEEEAEKKRREDLAKRKAQELEKQKAEEAKKQKERALAEQLRREQEEADRQRLVEQIEAEERAAKQQEADRRAAERTTTIIGKFFADIQRKVELKRTIDPSFETWRQSIVQIKVSPSGRVESVRTIKSSGSAEYDEAAEAGVYAASPVPMPDINQFPDAVDGLRTFELIMRHPNARR